MSKKLDKIQQDFADKATQFAQNGQQGKVKLEINFTPGGHLSKRYTIAVEMGASVSPGTARP